ncbi:hypothetical protein ACI3EY_07855 [Ornithinimicrobium sp. LYQ92]|uniref:hypothetical protein n=1 Tax=Serinicoccus sp. LYQ92 TaxID=3378798 RepID=UPI0038538A4C
MSNLTVTVHPEVRLIEVYDADTARTVLEFTPEAGEDLLEALRDALHTVDDPQAIEAAIGA